MKTRISLLLLSILLLAFVSFAQKPTLIPQLGHANDITAAAFAMDGKVLISSSKDNVVKLWNTATGELLQTLYDSSFVAVGPSGRTLLTVEARALKLHDLDTGQIRVLATEPILGEDYSRSYAQQTVAFTADGKGLLRVGPHPSSKIRKPRIGIQIWNLRDGSFRFVPLVGTFATAILSSDGELLVTEDSTETLANGEIRKKPGFVRVLKAETGKELYRIKVSPNESISGLSLSPDNRILVARSYLELNDSKSRTTAIFSEAGTGRELHRVTREGSGSELTFSPKGPIFASVHSRSTGQGKSDSVITIWDGITGKAIHELPVDNTWGSISISFTPDGRTLAASFSNDDDLEKNSHIQLWDTATGKRGRSLDSKRSEADHLIFSPDSKLLASWGAFYSPNSAEVWDVTTGKVVHEFAGHSSPVQFISISPDKKFLALGDNSNVRLWSLSSGDLRSSPVQGAFRTFSDGGQFLVTQPTQEGAEVTPDKAITRVWDLMRGSELHSFKGIFLSVSHDEKRMFTDTGSGGIKLWDVRTGKEVRTVIENKSGENFRSMIASPDGQYMAIVRSDSRKIELISVETGRVLKTMSLFSKQSEDAENSGLISLRFSPDSRLLASITGEMWDQHTLKMWNVATGSLVYKINAGFGAGVDITFSSNGTIIAGTGNSINTWNARSGRPLHTFDVAPYVFETAEYGTSASFSPDGKILVGEVGGGRIVTLLWDTATGRQLPLFKSAQDEASIVALSPDAKYAVSLERDGVIRFWQIADRRVVASLVLFDNDEWLVWKPDGFFDGSEKATRRFRWRRSANILDVAPGETNASQFRSPHLLANIFGAGQP